MNMDDQITMLTGRVLALGTLVEVLWADRITGTQNPRQEALAVKEKILNCVVEDSSDLAICARTALEQHLDEIIKRAGSILKDRAA